MVTGSFQRRQYHDKEDMTFSKPKIETGTDQLDKSPQKASPQTDSFGGVTVISKIRRNSKQAFFVTSQCC